MSPLHYGLLLCLLIPPEKPAPRRVSPKERDTPALAGPAALLTLSADGRTLAWVRRTYLAERKTWHEEMVLGDVGKGAVLRSIPVAGRSSCLALKADGKRLALGGEDGKLHLLDSATGKQRVSLDARVAFAPGEPRLTTRSGLDFGPVAAVTFTKDAKLLATVNRNRVRLWDATAGKELHTLQPPGGAAALAFSRDGKTLAVGGGSDSGGTVTLWEVASGRLHATLKGPRRRVTSVAFAADGSLLAGGSWDKTVHLWDVGQGKGLLVLAGHTAPVLWVALAADGRTLASASGSEVRLWDARTGKKLAPALGLNPPLTGLALTPDAKTLITAQSSGVRLWDLAAAPHRP